MQVLGGVLVVQFSLVKYLLGLRDIGPPSTGDLIDGLHLLLLRSRSHQSTGIRHHLPRWHLLGGLGVFQIRPDSIVEHINAAFCGFPGVLHHLQDVLCQLIRGDVRADLICDSIDGELSESILIPPQLCIRVRVEDPTLPEVGQKLVEA